jgi:hypothetical protein
MKLHKKASIIFIFCIDDKCVSRIIKAKINVLLFHVISFFINKLVAKSGMKKNYALSQKENCINELPRF